MRTFRQGSKVRWAAIVAALAAALALTACSPSGCSSRTQGDGKDAAPAPAGGPEYPMTVIDDASRSVTIPAKPERVVSLAPANTEVVAALGALDRLVGRTAFCDYPSEAAGVPVVGDFAQPNVEAIVGAEPDLVLATSGVQADVVTKLEESGAVVLVVDPQTVDALYSSIGRVATVLGDPAAGDRLIAEMRAGIAEVREAVGDREPVPVFLEIAQDPLYTVGSGTLMGELIALAGGDNVVTEQGYVAYSLEQLVKDDPKVYLATKGSMSDPKDLAKRVGFGSLAAVKSGRVAVLDDNLVSRPGPRIALGIRAMAEAIHPDAFGE